VEPTQIEGISVSLTLDYKGGKKEIVDTMPLITKNDDFLRQYVGIWRVMFDKVMELNAKKVLEFGTREGYSTRLFSKALRMTGGTITTVDINAPKEPIAEDNVLIVTSDVESYPGFPCDILYIDDWHNGWHLYYELNKFASWARVIMIHDVCLDDMLLEAIKAWCQQNMMIYTIYPMNGCGLAVIEVEKSSAFYANENKPTGEK